MSSTSGPDNRTQAELLHDLRYGAPQEQEEALSRLAAVGEAEALDAVIDYLREQPTAQRGAALDALRTLAHKYMPVDRYGLAEVLVPFLASDEWAHRLIASRLLNTHPNELATEPLRSLVEEALDKLTGETSLRVSQTRMMAERTLAESIMALASCGRLLALPDILAYLDDHSLRPIATRALGMIGSETERDHLEDLVEDEDVRVRDAAQWSLGLMDERVEMLINPPDQMQEPPPDRLSPVYWAHRQLAANADEVVQFLIVRIAIERLMLDAFLSDGRVPEECLITARRYEGHTPPEFRFNRAEIVGMWQYEWEGPALTRLDTPPPRPAFPPTTRPGLNAARGAGITISYPIDLAESGEGLVSFDCLFGPFFGRGWIYHVARRDGEWTFSLVRRSWAS